MTIVLDVIDVPGGQTMVVPSPQRIQATIAEMKRKLAVLEASVGEVPESDKAEVSRQITFLRTEMAQTAELDNKLRTEYSIRQMSFESRGFTSGVDKKARIAATTYSDGRRLFDQTLYEDTLVCYALQKDMAWLDEQDPSVVIALRREVTERGQPEPARLAFLSSALTSSPPQEG